MNFIYIIKEALHNLATSKLRTSLAMLGILVGTASVVAMVSSGELATNEALAQFKSLGTELLSVAIYSDGSKPEDTSKKSLTLNDAINIKYTSKHIDVAAPYILLFTPMSYDGSVFQGSVIGATEDLKQVIKISMEQGRFISFLDSVSYCCVIGNNIYQELKDKMMGSPLGKQFLLGNHYYTIVGVASPWIQNSFFNQDVNSSVFVPISTASELSNYAEISNIVMRLKTNDHVDEVEQQIQSYLKSHAPNKKLFFESAKQIIQSMEKQHQILTVLLGLIGGISLIVGGIGVMNIMLVSVIERRREIGIRRAIGAKRKDVHRMFLMEAVILSLLGGVFGVIVGVSISFLIAAFAHWEFVLYLLPPLVGFIVSVFVGIFFGFYPALTASRLDPITTLRGE